MTDFNSATDLNAVVMTLKTLLEKQDTRLERVENAMLIMKDAIVTSNQKAQDDFRREIRTLEEQVDQHAIEIGQLKQGLQIAGVLSGALAIAVIGVFVTNTLQRTPANANEEKKRAEIAVWVAA